MLIASLLSALVGATTIAQMSPAGIAPAPAVLNNGACMDSPRAVPLALQPPAVRSMQIVRIDRISSTSSMLQGQIIGFLYTLEDGTTWLGQRTPDYMSAASAGAINQVLASTHLPAQPVKAFPPQTKLGVSTKFEQYFKVNVPSGALEALQIQLQPCVVWPAGMTLPDPKV